MKKTLIVGASGGIGKAIAKEFANHKLFLTASRESTLNELKEEFPEATVRLFDHQSKQEAELIKEAEMELGGIDCLVIASGMTSDSLCMRLDDELWEKTIEVNLSSPFRLIKNAIKPLFKSSSGRVIVISSVIARMGNAGQVAYSASKAGLEGMVRTLAREFAGRNVTVNAVAPGFIKTGMTAELDQELIVKGIPLKRIGLAEEVAYGVEFLASDRAAYITGHTLEINGGLWMI